MGETSDTAGPRVGDVWEARRGVYTHTRKLLDDKDFVSSFLNGPSMARWFPRARHTWTVWGHSALRLNMNTQARRCFVLACHIRPTVDSWEAARVYEDAAGRARHATHLRVQLLRAEPHVWAHRAHVFRAMLESPHKHVRAAAVPFVTRFLTRAARGERGHAAVSPARVLEWCDAAVEACVRAHARSDGIRVVHALLRVWGHEAALWQRLHALYVAEEAWADAAKACMHWMACGQNATADQYVLLARDLERAELWWHALVAYRAAFRASKDRAVLAHVHTHVWPHVESRPPPLPPLRDLDCAANPPEGV